MRIGIDVGGTNTDAVLMDGDRLLGAVKSATTGDVTSGIVTALDALQRQHPFAPADVAAVMIGTTHFINALVEARGLAPTAALRLGLPATASLPPLVDWPQRLVDAVGGRGYLAHGGHEFDGRPISALDPDELRRHAADMAAHGIRSVAISSVFSPVNTEFEVRAAEIVAEELGPDVPISLSHEIGRVGLLERENATIINAALRELAAGIVDGLAGSVAGHGITAPLYLSQNDGTLMDVEFARRYPVATFASGPTNSMRGAAVLSGLGTCAVVDIGGTTTDVGVLTGGFPREATVEVSVAGIRTNFRMPDVLSVGIGGGSRIRGDGSADLTVGPDSVGYRLVEQALVFGGDVLTATDVAVAAGRASIGDPQRVAGLSRALVGAALERIAADVADVVDRMRVSADPLPVVAVGGGSVLLPDELPGLGAVHRPENFAVANAIGAAIAQVGGEVDRVFAIEPGRRDAVVDEARQEAVDRAVVAGADPATVAIVDFDEVPIPYLPGNATRIRCKAVGDLRIDTLTPEHLVTATTTAPLATAPTDRITADDLLALARGAAVLGTGGGGDPYIGRLLAEQALRAHGPVELVAPAALPADAAVFPVAMMGAPTVIVEKTPSVELIGRTVTALAEHMGVTPTHIACIEAGGINSTIPIVAAAQLGLPLVDGDGMGRAFPELQMVLPTLDGIAATPMSIADEKGNIGILHTVDNRWSEVLARSLTITMGCSAIISNYLLTGAQARTALVAGTLSLCRSIGRAVQLARDEHADPIAAAVEAVRGRLLHTGKVVDVARRTTTGFARGEARVAGPDGELVLHFQNEHLLALRDGRPLASTPDLIMVLDSDTAEPVTTESLRFGHRVCVLAAPADERWHSPGGIELVGPRYFGYDTDPVRFDGRTA